MITSAVLLGLAFVALLVIGLGLGIAAHRLPGAERVAAIIADDGRGSSSWRVACATGSRSPASRGRRRPALAFSAARLDRVDRHVPRGRARPSGSSCTLAQAALLTSGVALVTIVPSGPGLRGTFELTAVAIADGFGDPADSAFALGLLVHVDDPGDHLGRRGRRGSPARRRAEHRLERADVELGGALRDRIVEHGPVVRLEQQRLTRTTGHAQELEVVRLVHLVEQRDRLDVVRLPGRRTRLASPGPQAERQARAVCRSGPLK